MTTDRLDGLSVSHCRETLGLVTLVLDGDRPYGRISVTMSLPLDTDAPAFLRFIDREGRDGWTLAEVDMGLARHIGPSGVDMGLARHIRLIGPSGQYWPVRSEQ